MLKILLNILSNILIFICSILIMALVILGIGLIAEGHVGLGWIFLIGAVVLSFSTPEELI